jgi:hypothetical protein
VRGRKWGCDDGDDGDTVEREKIEGLWCRLKVLRMVDDVLTVLLAPAVYRS